MVKKILGVLSVFLLLVFSGCLSDSQKVTSEKVVELSKGQKFVNVLNQMKIQGSTEKRAIGEPLEGIYVTVAPDVKFYPLEYVLFTMTDTEKFMLADELTAASEKTGTLNHYVFGGKALDFISLISGKSFDAADVPVAKTVIPANTVVKNALTNLKYTADGQLVIIKTIELSDVTAQANGIFKVILSGKNFKDTEKVSSYEIKLNYNTAEVALGAATIAQCVKMSGDFAKAPILRAREDVKGEITIGATLVSPATGSLNGNLAEITFAAKTVASNITIKSITASTLTSIDIADKGIVKIAAPAKKFELSNNSVAAGSTFDLVLSGTGFTTETTQNVEFVITYNTNELSVAGNDVKTATTVLGEFAAAPILRANETVKGEITVGAVLIGNTVGLLKGDLAKIKFVATGATTKSTIKIKKATIGGITDFDISDIGDITITPAVKKFELSDLNVVPGSAFDVTLSGIGFTTETTQNVEFVITYNTNELSVLGDDVKSATTILGDFAAAPVLRAKEVTKGEITVGAILIGTSTGSLKGELAKIKFVAKGTVAKSSIKIKSATIGGITDFNISDTGDVYVVLP